MAYEKSSPEPPNSTGLSTPSRPALPIFLNSSWAGNWPDFSHSSTCGLISRSISVFQVWRSAACSGVNFIRLHPRDAERDGIERPDNRFARDRQREGQHLARVARIDDAIVPEMRRRIERRRLAVELIDNRLEHLVDLGPGWLLALTQVLLLGHRLHDAGRLLAAHHGGAAVGPREDEARIVGPTAHAIVARAEAADDHDGDLRDRGVGHRLDHLGAVLDDAAALGLGADHVTGGVLQIDDRRALLAAELDELRRLHRSLGGDRAVVADDANGLALDLGPAADRLLVVQALE